MVQDSKAGAKVKSTEAQRQAWEWSTVPQAHSPRDFAKLPFPWLKAKEDALQAQVNTSARAGKAKAGKRAETVNEATPAPNLSNPVSAESQRNLTDLADRMGLDTGTSKHRYAELYHMLFTPYRNQPITFLELGQVIAGPGHATMADGTTEDLPSIRLWLEFFPQASIHRLDASDFPGVRHDRVSFHRCDMDDRHSIAQARATMPRFDIIIDDASHASHHQQNSFLELFSSLKSGGIYIIEDLRSQPDTHERPGLTKTAALFRSFSETRRFAHDDAGSADAFNALGDQISGCFLFQVGYDKKRKDQVAVIQKR